MLRRSVDGGKMGLKKFCAAILTVALLQQDSAGLRKPWDPQSWRMPFRFIGKGDYLQIALLAAVGLVACCVLTGCPGNRQPDPFFILTRSAAALVDKPGKLIVNSRCQSGEQLLGGGYVLVESATNGSLLTLTGNYPSADDTWTITIDTPTDSNFNKVEGTAVVAVAYCLTTPNFPVDMVTVSTTKGNSGTPFPTVTTSCPAGSVLTGGGYRTERAASISGTYNGEVMFSAPEFDTGRRATGWQVNLAYVWNEAIPETTVFARCARKNLSEGTVVVQSVDLTKLAAAFDRRDFEVECPPNSFTTGGGYWLVGDPTIPHWVWLSYARNEYARWRAAGYWGFQTPNYPTHPCDPNINPDCVKFGIAAVCIPFPNIPVVKVKITSPANGAHFPSASGTFGHEITTPITFTAEATDEDGTPLKGASLQWTLDGTWFGMNESFTTSLPAFGFAQRTVRVTATGKKTSASDQITISTGEIP
jgi:hypothetical protein